MLKIIDVIGENSPVLQGIEGGMETNSTSADNVDYIDLDAEDERYTSNLLYRPSPKEMHLFTFA